MLKYCLYPLLAFSLTACASNPDGEEKLRGIAAYKSDVRLGDKVNSICFASNIDGFREAKKDTVIIEGSGRSEYLVSTRGCFQLRNAMSIGLQARETCLRPGSIILVSDEITPVFRAPSTGLGPDRCFIDEIYKWNKKAQDEEEAETAP